MAVQLKMPPVMTETEQKWQPPPQGQWTYADFLNLPSDGWRYEIIRGELYMSPPPKERHQYSSTRLVVAFDNFVKPRKLGRVYAAPIGVTIGELATPVQPDIIFVARERLKKVVTEDGINGAPDLIVEILSPSNWADDRRTKFRLYEQAGVREYWIVDPRACTVEVFVLRGKTYDLLGKWGVGEAARSEILSGFQVAVGDLCESEELG
jgi:Uma2 family endonuclease